LISEKFSLLLYRTISLLLVLYGCETWYLALREEHRLRVFENRVLRGIFGQKCDDVTKNGGSCTVRSFITCTYTQMLLGGSNQVKLVGQSMRLAWERRESVQDFGGKARK
jgi:hypothetical protein